MAVVPADQKFSVAAQAIYDNSELPGLIPSDQRDRAVAQIAQALGHELHEVERLPDDAGGAERRTVGAKAAGAGYKAVSQLKKQWQMPAPGQQVQRGVGAEQQQTAQPGQGAQAGSGQVSQPGRGQGTQGPVSPAALPPDIAAAARAGLSGPPLTSASRLSADRQGSRGTTSTTPAVQRQGPETQR